ncbi:MAG: DUF2156 domain-containing protein [Candidatus Lokiarchaeota archaeon]|nr:DUF2156 domain-containing protein [Candidatus Lokiarchaeota archaeon]
MDLSTGKPIEITDKKLFDEYIHKYPPETSEFTFTNLFMWRNYYNFLFMEFKEHLILFSNDYLKNRKKPINSDSKDYLYFFLPIGSTPDKIIIELFENLGNIEVHRVPEYICEKLTENEKFNDLNLVCLEDLNNWDYVYNKDEILNLAGNKYRQNRRWLQKFLSNYNYDFKLLTEKLIEKCKELQLEWCIMRACTEDESLEAEQEAIYEALNNFSTLGFSGGLLCVDDKCAAYTFGEMLNDKTLVIHIEKAHMEYEGSYQAINNFFLKNCCIDAVHVNREQDLGIEGLRRAKESYKPIKMIKKSIIYQKK